MGSNAWAYESALTTMTGRVGLADNTSAAFYYASKPVTLADGDSYVFTFVNHNAGSYSDQIYYNWIAECNDGTSYFDLRADGGHWFNGANVNFKNASYSGNTSANISATANIWQQAYNGVTVTMTVSRSGSSITVTHTAMTNAVDAVAGQTYSGTYTVTYDGSNALSFYITNEKSYQDIIKVDCNGTQFNYVSSESAYTDQANATTNYNGASVDNLKIYSTQFRDWGSNDGTVKVNGSGKIAFYKFDLTEIKSKLAADGGTITGVTFSVYGKGNGGDCGKVRVLGYNSTWDASTINNNNVSNSSGSITGLVTSTGSFQPLNTTTERTLNSGGVTLSENTLTYVNSAIAENKDYVSFAITANYTREGLMNTFANLSFTYSAAVLYEATFSETNSLNPTVTVYTDDSRTTEIAKNELKANTTYYYRAVLAGYYDYEGSFDIATSNLTVNFTMPIKPRYTFTVNAVNSVGGAVIQALYTDDDSYDGKTHNVSFPAYLTGVGNAVTYSKDNSTYYQSYTSASADATKTQSYTAYTGEAYFFEGEDITGAVRYTGASFGPRSSNGAAGVLNTKTVTSLDAGVYRITARSIGRSDHTHSLYKTSTEGEKIFDVDVSTTGTIESAIISLDATTDIVAKGGYSTTSDNGSGFDYFLIEKTGGPITLNGSYYSTFSNAQSVQITGATAYVAKVNGEELVLKPVNDDNIVPAGTGVILKGEKGVGVSYEVTDASATVQAANDLQPVLTTIARPLDRDIYVLHGDEFWRYTGANLVAGKAYLDLTGYTSKLRMTFADDDATAINSVESEKADNGAIYNLAGQRVGKDYKGIVIKNGKKFMNK